MTNHERWVVYPLLFMTLGIVMRDKVWPQQQFQAQSVAAERVSAYREMSTHRIRCNRLDVGQLNCQSLAVTGPKGAGRIRLGLAPGGGGRLVLSGGDGKAMVVAGPDETGRGGSLEILDSEGAPQVQLLSTPSGGIVTTVRQDRKIWLVFGHQRSNYGVFAQAPELGRGALLTLPWRLQTNPDPGRPTEESPEKPAEEPEKPDDS